MSGVAVIGMHRSGTSAITRVLNLLGLHTCVDTDLLGADDFNTRGHWESSTVTSCSELLLWTVQAAWWVPPAERDWLSPWSQRLVPAAAEAFASVHPIEPWVVKDPRLSLTLPFWRQAINVSGVVIACRHPSSIVDSLRRRASMAVEYGVSLWERYTRELLLAAAGMPALVTFYDTLIDDSERWTSSAEAFLAGLGMQVRGDKLGEVATFLSEDMRHFRGGREIPMSAAQIELWDRCRDLVGNHERLPRVELPLETPATRRQFASARRDLRPPEWGPHPSPEFVKFREAVETTVAAPR